MCKYLRQLSRDETFVTTKKKLRITVNLIIQLHIETNMLALTLDVSVHGPSSAIKKYMLRNTTEE